MKLPSGMQVFQRGWLSANNILFTGGDGSALVDSGYVSHAPQTLALLEHALQGAPLGRLINTHLHSDHCGGNAALQARYACHTTIPASEADAVREWDEDKLTYKATGQACNRFRFDATYEGGDRLRLGIHDWEVLAAPGHDPHSLVLYCPAEGILISADALWENGFGVIFPELVGEPGFAATRATLEMIASLDVRLVIPGHGAPFSDVRPALDRAFKRIDFLAADPVRNAGNGVKVLVKFRLLHERALSLQTLEQWMRDIPLLRISNQRYLHKTPAELAAWTASELARAGAARLEGTMLLDA